MAARAPRAQLTAWGDFYVWLLPQIQLAQGELDAALEAVGCGDQPLTSVVRQNLKGDLELSAAGYADGVAMSQQMDDQRRSWTERRLVVRSVRQAHAAEVALRARVSKTMTQIEALNPGG